MASESELFVKMTDILQAIFNCDLKKLKFFLSDSPSINCEIPGTEGCTPLHLLVGVENVIEKDQVLSYFLEIGADPNARSYDDLTPVHIAAMWNNCSELEKLLKSGGNPWLTDNEKKNAFDLAMDNHAYEAYQLLNKFLSEDKLNFRVRETQSSITPSNYKQNNLLNTGMIKGNKTYSRYFSAHENFPLYFSSSDDSSESLLNVSKILKKDLTKNQSIERKNYSKLDDSGKISSTKGLLSDICSNKYSSDYSEMNEKQFCSTKISLASNKYSSDYSEMDQKQICSSKISSASNKYSSDYSEMNEKQICSTKISLTSDETEIYSTSENEYVIQEESFDDNSETIVDSDEKSGIVLIERSASSMEFSSFKSCNISDCDNYITNDWKSCHSQSISCVTENSCNSHSNSFFIPPDFKKLSNTSIYLQLTNLGDNPGPVSNSTRAIYLRRLAHLKSGCNTSCNLPNPKYCNEVYMFLEGKIDAEHIKNMMNAMSEEFNSAHPKQNWREGNQRSCFNYFLLDPRVTQNLPSRLKQLTYEKAFLTFLDALFYVGKGMRSRPFSHLIQAAKAAKDAQWKNDKIAHILDIWESGHGVISLHCFNNCIPVEAYTQEACIIDAIGLENLTNIKNGNYYGAATKWKWSYKRKVGVELLHRALQIFILEGEKQILPKDIRTK